MDRSAMAGSYLDVVFGDRDGIVCFAFGVGGHFEEHRYRHEQWVERFGRWPDDRDRLIAEALEKSAECDVYIAPYLRSNRSRKKGSAVGSDMLYADLDQPGDEIRGFERLLLGPGGLLVSSGGGRHVYLKLPELVQPELLEVLNRRLALTLGADSGWSTTKVLRLPGTYNHKPRARGGKAALVEILELRERAPQDWSPAELDTLLKGLPKVATGGVGAVLPEPLPPLPAQLERRRHEPPGDDRSDQTFTLLRAALDAGLTDGQALTLGLEHPPTVEKYGARAETEIERVISKLRTENGRAPVPQSTETADEAPVGPPDFSPFSRFVPDSDSSEEEWPHPPAPAAYYGLPGRIVATIAPHSEADPVALLAQTLVVAGSIIGRGCYFEVEATRHYTNLFVDLVGETGKARKGSSYAHIERLGKSAEPPWGDRVESGLSSGEGLIWAIRDSIEGRRDEDDGDPGVADKRLLVFESEFASVLRVLERQGNKLSAIVRDAWDGRPLRTLVKNSPGRCERPHVSIIGHITSDELRRYLDRTEIANGFGNRFLWLCVRRSQFLPEGGEMHKVNVAPLVKELAAALEFARSVQQIERDAEARQLWHETYESLSAGRPGLAGALTARAEAQVMRLAMIYALLDRSPQIKRPHLEAALALWDYCERSVAYVFGDSLGDPIADRILHALRQAPDGLTRTELREFTGKSVSAAQIDRALGLLQRHRLAHVAREETGGRPAERWFYPRGRKGEKDRKGDA